MVFIFLSVGLKKQRRFAPPRDLPPKEQGGYAYFIAQFRLFVKHNLVILPDCHYELYQTSPPSLQIAVEELERAGHRQGEIHRQVMVIPRVFVVFNWNSGIQDLLVQVA